MLRLCDVLTNQDVLWTAGEAREPSQVGEELRVYVFGLVSIRGH